MKNQGQFLKIASYLILALGLRFLVVDRLLANEPIWWLQLLGIALIFGIGIGYVFRGTAKVIEETTDVLQDRTRLAGGLLQAFGTAFPDMVIGVVAAAISLKVRDTDYTRSVNLAIIAASTTFGSNIYNILHATWCIARQNLANLKNKSLLMFPPFQFGGILKPLAKHARKPVRIEMDNAIHILTALTALTAFCAISMVLFGKVENTTLHLKGDLYQLIQPVGFVLLGLCFWTIFRFRKSNRPLSHAVDILEEGLFYLKSKTWRIWLDLILSGVAILFAAESMVKAMEVFSDLLHIPFVITGVLAGLIGCFGEMVVVHNFSVNPKGRIGDAIVGVAMDNIVTTLGAAIVAIMGGIFLGGNSLILIFIIILASNTLLVEQISKLKNSLQ
ncbi:MAG: hypothetical protein V1936_03510 [Patescibacteria group bacterium]